MAYQKTEIPIQKSNPLPNFLRSFSELKQNGSLRIRIGSNPKFPFPKFKLNCTQDLRVWGSLKCMIQLYYAAVSWLLFNNKSRMPFSGLVSKLGANKSICFSIWDKTAILIQQSEQHFWYTSLQLYVFLPFRVGAKPESPFLDLLRNQNPDLIFKASLRYLITQLYDSRLRRHQL